MLSGLSGTFHASNSKKQLFKWFQLKKDVSMVRKKQGVCVCVLNLDMNMKANMYLSRNGIESMFYSSSDCSSSWAVSAFQILSIGYKFFNNRISGQL